MSESKSHVIVQDCIISQCGKVSVGFEISESDVDPNTWGYLVRNDMVRSVESIIESADAEADGPKPEVSSEPESTGAAGDDTKKETSSEPETKSENTNSSEIDSAEIIATVKALLADGKRQMLTIINQTGFTDEVLAPLLTEENGFTKNQQGWFSLV